jgi:hypothetical protein
MTSWRDKFKIHPAADVFPMISDEELLKLGEDIKANGLKTCITVNKDGVLLDGRNRLEAMERAGIDLECVGLGGHKWKAHTYPGDPIPYIISLNIHRRHLTKQQQTDLIVAALKAAEEEAKKAADKKPDQVDPVSKGGRGKANPIRTKAVAEAKKHGISEATVKRSLAKANPKPPPKPVLSLTHYKRPLPKPKSSAPVTGIEAARRYYLEAFAKLDQSEWDGEREMVLSGINEIVGKALNKGRLN